MTITPDDDRPVDPYAELIDDDDALGEDVLDDVVVSDGPDADERPVPLDDEV